MDTENKPSQAAAAYSIVLEEEIDPNYVPSEAEVVKYAKWLGMDLEKDHDLFWIAGEGLVAPLPKEWRPCRTKDTGDIYYFNFTTGESTWDHPCDAYYERLYEEEKKKKETMIKANGERTLESGTRHPSAVPQQITAEIKQPQRLSSSPPSPDLIGQCAQLLQDVAPAPPRSDLMQRRDLLQAQYDAADAADEDFELVAALGLQLRSLEQQAAQLPLSEEAYLTLPDRHAQLVKKVTVKCKELKAAQDFDALSILAKQLNALKALDISTVRPANCDHPVVPKASALAISEEENALDPVLPPTKGIDNEMDERRDAVLPPAVPEL